MAPPNGSGPSTALSHHASVGAANGATGIIPSQVHADPDQDVVVVVGTLFVVWNAILFNMAEWYKDRVGYTGARWNELRSSLLGEWRMLIKLCSIVLRYDALLICYVVAKTLMHALRTSALTGILVPFSQVAVSPFLYACWALSFTDILLCLFMCHSYTAHLEQLMDQDADTLFFEVRTDTARCPARECYSHKLLRRVYRHCPSG